MAKARKGESGSTPDGIRADVIPPLVRPERSANTVGCTSMAGVGRATVCRNTLQILVAQLFMANADGTTPY